MIVRFESCRNALLMVLCCTLAACSNFTPTEKTAAYDPMTGATYLPAPCPDWSQSQTGNYLNEPHSNYGCAVNTNMALQLDDPRDLHRGHGDNRPESGITADVVGAYRAGKIPVPSTSSTDSSSQ